MTESGEKTMCSGVRKRSGLFMIVSALSIATVLASGECCADDESTLLFNGKDLKGWHLLDVPQTSNYHTRKDNFFVKDNAIHCAQLPTRNGALLLSDEKYDNFELTLEMKSDWGCDSGIFLRANEIGKGIQVLNDYLEHGSIGFPHKKDIQIPVHFVGPEECAAVPGVSAGGDGNSLLYAIDASGWNKAWKRDGWNRLKIRIMGSEPMITTWINGSKVMEYHGNKRKGTQVAAGYIALQVHPGGRWKPGGHARYRNISIQKLKPATECAATPSPKPASQWENLLDRDLSKFEVWLGVPHTSVKGLPDSYVKGTPLGLNNDPKNVFSVKEKNGELVLGITGEIWGGLTTLKEYGNYHLSYLIKWGDKKWAPRLGAKRDSGLLYHCNGEHGAHTQNWKSSVEMQIQENDLGDCIGVKGSGAQVRCSLPQDAKRWRYDPKSETFRYGYISAYPELDKPHGEWNLMELYTIGRTSVHVVNGEVVLVAEDARNKQGPLTNGQLQIQSEGAECYFKDIKLRPITEFPASIRSKMRLRENQSVKQ